VLDACDALDGVRDGFIENPTRCHFDPASIQCPAKEDYAACLTPAQVDTARKIYAGARFADGTQIYPGLEPGSELGWDWLLAGPQPMAINYGFFANIVFQDPKWDFRTFDVDRDTRLAEARVGKMVDMIEPNLKPFKDHGGKLLMYQSWQEPGIPPRSLVNYYDRVVDKMGGSGATNDFVRLFMVPGAGMCSGFGIVGMGAFDAFDEIQKWRETGVAPDKIITSHRVDGVVERTHPACPYPQEAIYKGTGDPYDAASFTCGVPKR